MRTLAPRLAVGLSCQVLLFLVTGCGGGSDAGPAPPPAPPPPAADTTAPSVPQGVTATAQSTSSIAVAWTASTDTGGAGVAGYRVFRNGSITVAGTVNAPTTIYTDTGLNPGTNYSYTVAAFDAATPNNVSALSMAASATTNAVPADTTAPSVPQGVTATVFSSSSIRISWTASTDTGGAGLAGYQLFRNGSATAIASVTVPTTSYTDTGLTAATSYSYTVRAYDAANPGNMSALSTAANATTDPPSGPPVTVTVQRVFPNLPNFNQPVAMLQAPGNSARWYVVEKTGTVRVFDNTPNVSATSVFIDIASRLDSVPANVTDERGLLGMAFHPNYPTDPRVYLFYTGTDPALGAVDRVSQFHTVNGGVSLSTGTELELLNVADPESNHNGGNIAFGPDGFLYIGIGDGGGGGDVHGTIGNGQRLTTLLGKMLRINIASSTVSQPYVIPLDNPYPGNARCTGGTGTANCPEIFAYGFRNPWRWSFDRVSGQLWLNDVGQSTYEEVDLVTLGGNYGWRCREGAHVFNGNTATTCGPNMGSSIDPVAEYGRALGFSTTGGFVYRGTAIAALRGRYVFGDFGGRMWNIGRDTPPTQTLAANSGQATGLAISSFGQDVDGELYIVDLGSGVNTGTLHKIVP